MGSARVVCSSYPCGAVQDFRRPDSLIPKKGREKDAEDTEDGCELGFWKRCLPRWIVWRTVARRFLRRSYGSGGRGFDTVEGLCCAPRGGAGRYAAFGYRFFGAVDPLPEGQRADGRLTGVCIVHAEERSHDFDGREERSPQFVPSPVHVTVVLIRIRRNNVQLQHATLRVKATGTLVLFPNGALRPAASGVGIPCDPVCTWLIGGTVAFWKPGDSRRLRGGVGEDRRAHAVAWAEEASDEECVGERENATGVPRCVGEFGAHDLRR